MLNIFECFVFALKCDDFVIIVLSDEPRQNQGRGSVDRNLLKVPPPPHPEVILLLAVQRRW